MALANTRYLMFGLVATDVNDAMVCLLARQSDIGISIPRTLSLLYDALPVLFDNGARQSIWRLRHWRYGVGHGLYWSYVTKSEVTRCLLRESTSFALMPATLISRHGITNKTLAKYEPTVSAELLSGIIVTWRQGHGVSVAVWRYHHHCLLSSASPFTSALLVIEIRRHVITLVVIAALMSPALFVY